MKETKVNTTPVVIFSINTGPKVDKRPYYLTRPRSADEMVKINREGDNARALAGACFGTGFLAATAYFIIKVIKSKKAV